MFTNKVSLRGAVTPQMLITLIVGVAIFVIAGATYFFLTSGQPSASPDTLSSDPFSFGGPNTSSGTGSSQTTPGATVDVAVVGGSPAPVRDFLHDPGVTQVGSTTEPNHYYVVSAPSQNADDPSYRIEYFPSDKSFLISLFREPLGEVRKNAVEDLQNRLGLSEQNLCSVAVEVGTSVEVNSLLGARSLGLPNCPGAYQFAGD